jgi:hypothetical protein
MGATTLVLLGVSGQLTGCASNSGVVQMGSDSYMVSRQAASGFTGMSTLKADAMREAYARCQQTGQSVEVVETVDAKPPYIFGNFPKTEIRFKCVNEVRSPRGTAGAQIDGVEASPKASSLYEELNKLDELRKRGLLTEEEFNAEKQKLLSRD